jgi:hypothetical protein
MFVVVRPFETKAFPCTSKTFPTGLVPAPKFEIKLRVDAFKEPMFDEFTNKFVVVKALDAKKFPDISSAFPVGLVPIPMFETTTSEKVLTAPETFELVTKTFVVVRAFDAETLGPWNEFTKRLCVFADVQFELTVNRFPNGVAAVPSPIVEELATIFPYKFVVVP